ncbi:uncharacterized protein MELLADRAFT_96094 [Melampsora larici-populina 98AG31]|uniref:Uncharacterized protein n=1 Tax=Melampsora larici-populina (strain 98AG31 / pathotype 3-4-7) TaxID=747676 RepID=F4SAY0_MELLP|nr:uncharacterized protein MELLADRAFT_96094 [Melampsora larici-populina 98AG31]EGF98206.1 hypothetical protein MELLADRAFT_96094 [Melampsora larici-populina 98AG31]
MAFRYDMAVRTTVLTLRNSDGKLANPGDRNEELERDARLDSEQLGDFDPCFADCNPYADGQIKSHINPISGERLRQNTPSFGPSRNDHSMSSTFGKPNARSWGFANQVVYEGPGAVNFTNFDDHGYGSCLTRGRGRGGGYGGGRDLSPRGRRGQDSYDNRRAEGSGSWREDRREDRRSDERVPTGPKFGGNGKAKKIQKTYLVRIGVCSPPNDLIGKPYIVRKACVPALKFIFMFLDLYRLRVHITMIYGAVAVI